MLGKASEIEMVELRVYEVAEWKKSNPNVPVLDIKYANSTSGVGNVLIIYKEAQYHEQ